jgi:hypothetical protein
MNLSIEFLDNKYTKWYFSMIENARGRINSPEEYLESHHIIPKCMNGRNDADNLVALTAREHFIAHVLLTKMVDKNHFSYPGLLSAVLYFKNKCDNSILYESARKVFSEMREETYDKNSEKEIDRRKKFPKA